MALGALVLAAARHAATAPAPPPPTFRFAFGPDAAPPGHTQVAPLTPFMPATGFGFEPAPDPSSTVRFFSVALPEGSYRVTVTLGEARAPGDTTIFAELRRLMLERVVTRAGQFSTRTFIVNVRRPVIPGGGGVTLKERETTTEARAWDDRLTLAPVDRSAEVQRDVLRGARSGGVAPGLCDAAGGDAPQRLRQL